MSLQSSRKVSFAIWRATHCLPNLPLLQDIRAHRVQQCDETVDRHDILTGCQHGFRASRSCETQLVTVAYYLASSLDSGIQTDLRS